MRRVPITSSIVLHGVNERIVLHGVNDIEREYVHVHLGIWTGDERRPLNTK